MQVQDFCKQMETQLKTFEKSIRHIEERLDAGGTAAKQKILPVVGDIKNLLTELRLQKERLESECPSDWSEEKAEMEGLVGQIGSSIDRTWTQIPPGNIGG
jgi:hypothetical protein